MFKKLIFRLLAVLFVVQSSGAFAERINCNDILQYDGNTWVPANASLSLSSSTATTEWDFVLISQNPPYTGKTQPEMFVAPLNQEVVDVAQFIYPNQTLVSYEAFPIVDQGNDSTGVTFFRLRDAKNRPYGAFLVMGWGFYKCGNF